MDKKKVTSFLIGGCAGLVVAALWLSGVTQGLEYKSMDLRFKLRGTVKPSPDVAVIAFDEESFARLGRWPWPRKLHGQVAERLKKAGARSIVIDVLLPEPDGIDPSSDLYLARSLESSRNAVLASYFRYDAGGNPVEFLLPAQSFRKGAVTGFANIVPELDGICRKVPLFKEFDGRIIPSLALAGLSVAEGKAPEDILGEGTIRYDAYNEMLLNFAGGYKHFPIIHFTKCSTARSLPGPSRARSSSWEERPRAFLISSPCLSRRPSRESRYTRRPFRTCCSATTCARGRGRISSCW